MKPLCFLTVFLLTTAAVRAQDSTSAKKWVVAGAHAGVWAGTFIALNKAWYADYPRSAFHFFNDGAEWNQMDKAGHAWTAYQLSRVSAATWKWAGLTPRKAAWVGAASAVAFQSIIEIQDGFSAEWGFSWWDMTANAGGAAAYLAQELAWQEQRIHIKLGYWPHNYPSGLEGRRDELFGWSAPGRVLKDYNSQTYWISGNVRSFFPRSAWPRWLMLSLGYGSDVMLGGRTNQWQNKQGQTIDRSDLPRVRRYYLSVDVDLTQIPTRNRAVKTLFFLFNAVKIPAPALELNAADGVRAHWLHP
ncbi:MAG: DUF2279 domain-containing protein [Flavihumibacter sp.]